MQSGTLTPTATPTPTPAGATRRDTHNDDLSARSAANATSADLRLSGDKIKIGSKRIAKEYTASAKSTNLIRGPSSRPSSAIPMLHFYNDTVEFEHNFHSRRPASAEHGRNTPQTDFKPCNLSGNRTISSSLQSIDELEQDSLDQSPISSKSSWRLPDTPINHISQSKPCNVSTALTPGLRAKPPIPPKCEITIKVVDFDDDVSTDKGSDFEGARIEEIVDCEPENYNLNTISKTVQYPHWSSIDNEIQKIENDTDMLLEKLKLDNKPLGLRSKSQTSLTTPLVIPTRPVSQSAFNCSLKSVNPKRNESKKTLKFTPRLISTGKDCDEDSVKDIESWMAAEVVEDVKDKQQNSCKKDHSEKNNDVDAWILENSEQSRKQEEKELRVVREFLDTPENDAKSVEDHQDAASVDEGSTYDEIASILELLEGESKKSRNKIDAMKNLIKAEAPGKLEKSEMEIELDKRLSFLDEPPIRQHRISSGPPINPSTNFTALLTYLDEVDKNCAKSIEVAKDRVAKTEEMLENAMNLDSIPKVHDFQSFSKQELSQQIIDLNLRLKDKSSSIALLQKELSTLREQILKINKENDQVVKQKVKAQKDESESVVKRHQKFIDQLMADKKHLSEQYDNAIREMKSADERFASNLKAIEHKHRVELQKVKEMQIAGEKMRRDKWIDVKTQKIKEMTAKSIEPEINSMTMRHQNELADLRSLHTRELEDLELKAARKTQQQCEALRQQLCEEREKALAHERELIRIRYEKMVESEEKSYQEQRRRLHQDHANRVTECEAREANAIAEKERLVKQSQNEFEEKLQAAIRRHNTDLKLLKEKTDVEMETWKNNYRKQQTKHLIEREASIREACRHERDHEIELVIERLEREANETKQQIEETAENRIKRVKEKFASELRDVEQNEREAIVKSNQLKAELVQCSDEITTLRANIKNLENQLDGYKEKINKFQQDRSNLKDVLRAEVHGDVERLEREVLALKHAKETEMQQVCGRVKIAMARKDDIIAEITRDNSTLQQKCRYLESMMDQQRKEFLIK